MRHPGGFGSDCWTDGVQFLKVWRTMPPATDLAVVGRLASAGLPVPAPSWWGTYAGRVCAVYPYVEGRPAGDEDRVVVARTLRRVHETPTAGLDLPVRSVHETWVPRMRTLLDHPWIADRRAEAEQAVERLERSMDASAQVEVPLVVAHTDYGGGNLLISDDGEVAAILDWDHACLAPREDDLWVAARDADPRSFLDAYGRDVPLDRTHLERALLARAVRDCFARLVNDVDRPGVDLWGFDRWRRVDDDLALLLGD